MAAYSLQFQEVDTIAVGSHLNSGETSFTLTGGNFGSPTGTQLYVVDYNIPGSAEIISATVTGANVTSVTRGLSGGAAGTTNHAASATVGAFFVPQHYDALAQGTGFATGTTSIGIPTTAIRQEALSTWVPTLFKSDGVTALTGTLNQARYQQAGKWVRGVVNFSAINNPSGAIIYFTLPVGALGGGVSANVMIGAAWTSTNGTVGTGQMLLDNVSGSRTVCGVFLPANGAWATGAGQNTFWGTFEYEAF